ncbi:L,D-transpeptidase [Rhizobiales bacterium]|uniref:L,D-transpeptidase n=1 Tax=Hongsoonwoonella zoysiae TaxID=2821844 RepID=UPI0015604038|nr:L,D-transpeptidase [Hongsoonwoonella zoysiae]NRG18465.1 L,D-transpeptidase [Hongsoonwoonella zoysiae]
MRKLLGIIAALAVTFSAAEAMAQAGGQFFDPVSKQWITYGPLRGGKSPIRRETVRYDGPYGPGTIIVDTGERRLYHVQPGGKATKYGVGVGREGFQWAGTHRVTRKAEWPGWTPPPQMRARAAAKGQTLPAYMEGGPNNPLGARALYIGSTLYRIHGSNEPWTIGTAVSSGCIRMANEDVIHLYNNVGVGTKVVVRR